MVRSLRPASWPGSVHVARARDHLAEAERVAPGEGPDAHRGLHVVGGLRADAAVHDAVHVVPVAPQEREVEDLQLRGHAAPDRGAGHHEVDEALLELLDHLALLAEGAARKDADLDRAAGRRLGQLAEEVAEGVQRRGAGGHRVGESEDDPAVAAARATGPEQGTPAAPRRKSRRSRRWSMAGWRDVTSARAAGRSARLASGHAPLLEETVARRARRGYRRDPSRERG